MMKNLQFKAVNFNAISRQACLAAKEGKFDLSIQLAMESLKIYPKNPVLILELINIFKRSTKGENKIPEVDDLILCLLEGAGKGKSVFELLNGVSLLRSKIYKYSTKERPCHTENSTTSTHKCHKHNPLRMGILSCIWKRPKLTKIFLNHLKLLATNLRDDIELVPVIIGSEEENERIMCEQYNFFYDKFPNEPLSRKWEYGIKVTESMDLDAVVILGSDDFINANLLLVYKDMLANGVHFAGIRNGYFFDMNNAPERLVLWKGYGSSSRCLGQPHRLGEAIGMARLFSRRFLEELDFSLWPDININSGLDLHALKRIRSFGGLPISYYHFLNFPKKLRESCYCQVYIDANELSTFAVDIKYGNANITSFDKYTMCDCTHSVIPDAWRVLSKTIGEETKSQLSDLSIS